MSSKKKDKKEVEEDDEDLWNPDEESDEDTHKAKKELVKDVVGDEDEASDDGEADEDAEEEEEKKDLFEDDEDRAKLMALPQLEREQILYNRSLKREEEKKRRMALKEFKKKDKKKKEKSSKDKKKDKSKKEKKAKKRKREKEEEEEEADEAEAAKEEEEEEEAERRSTRSSKRARKEGSKEDTLQSALSDIKARRDKSDDRGRRVDEADDTYAAEVEEEEAADQPEEQQPKKKRHRADDDEYEEEAEDDDERREREREESLPEPAQQTPIDYTTLKILQLRRVVLEKLVDEPYFKDYVKGKFVKFQLGISPNSQKQIYKIAEIMDVQEYPKKYRFAGVDRKKGLLLQIGTSKRLWRMDVVSNQSFTEEEFHAWLSDMNKYGAKPLTREEARARKNQAEHLRSTFVYTPDMVKTMVEEKKQLSTKHINLALERTRLQMALQEAKENNDDVSLKRITRELENIDEYASKQRQLAASSKDFGIHEVNRKKQKANIEAEDKISLLKLEDRKAGIDTGGLLKRRETRPAIYWTGATDEELREVEDKARRQEEEKERKAKEDEEKEKQKKKEAADEDKKPKKQKRPEKVIVDEEEFLVEPLQSPTGRAPMMLSPTNAGGDPAAPASLVPPDEALQRLRKFHNFDVQIDLQAKPKSRPFFLTPYLPDPNDRNKYQQFITLEEYEARYEQEGNIAD